MRRPPVAVSMGSLLAAAVGSVRVVLAFHG
jgi:hypothetical protein